MRTSWWLLFLTQFTISIVSTFPVQADEPSLNPLANRIKQLVARSWTVTVEDQKIIVTQEEPAVFERDAPNGPGFGRRKRQDATTKRIRDLLDGASAGSRW